MEGASSRAGRCEAAYSLVVPVCHKEEAVAKAIGNEGGDVDTSTRISMWEWDGSTEYGWRAASVSV